jgi:hypothetical protein
MTDHKQLREEIIAKIAEYYKARFTCTTSYHV